MALLALAVAAVLALGGGGMQETKAQKDARMGWWRDARLGMFIHFGLYSIPAGTWGNQTGHGEWIRETAQIPVEEYDKFKAQFNPTKFDADAWVKMAKDAGMKYVVITTKHHDGFALFDSKETDWCVRESPFKRDIMAEMAAACKKYGLKMCWYHSIMDWHHPDYLPRRSWEGSIRPPGDANFDRYVLYLRDQVRELLTKYGPIGVMWFDGEWESTWSDYYGAPLYALCRQLQPNVIVNNRVSNNRGGSIASDGQDQRVGDFSTPEQTIPATGLPGVDWETCMTMNDHWGYNSHDKNWKSTKELITNIVDIASKGGNYLLNVGPRADGTFPPESVQRLKEIGDWMKVNGASIYGTTASVFDNLPWGRSTTKRNGNGTTTLFLHVLTPPADRKLVVPGLGSRVAGAHVLGGGKLNARRAGADVIVEFPTPKAKAICTTVALDIEGEPTVYKTPTIEVPSEEIVDPVNVKISSGTNGLDIRYTLNGAAPSAKAALYTQPIRVAKTTTVKAAAFHQGKRVSTVASRTVRRVEPMPAVAAASTQPGLSCDEYMGNWDKVPDWATIKPAKTFVATTADFARADSKPVEYVGRRYHGFIDVPADGLYAFALTSDDGSRLHVDGKLVVDHDGLHGSETKIGHVPLARGKHRLEIGWFNKTGGAALALAWGKLGHPVKPVTAGQLSH